MTLDQAPMDLSRAATLLIALLLISGTAAGFTKGGEYQRLEQADEPFQKQSTWDRFFGTFSVFDSASGDQIFEPGETVTVEHTLTSAIDGQVDASNTIIAVETYLCNDAGCDDPRDDRLIKELSWRTGTDAIGNFGSGTTFHGSVDLTIPTDTYTVVNPVTLDSRTISVKEARYATVIYVVDTANNRVISEVWNSENQNEDWRYTFDVAVDDTSSGDDGSTGDDTTSEAPEINVVGTPQTSVSGRTVTTQVTLENTGGATQETWMIEQQIRNSQGDFLTFSTLSGPMFCDPDHPENVHKTFTLGSGESLDIKLQSTVPEEAGSGNFQVRLLTGTKTGETSDTCTGTVKEPYSTPRLVGWVTIDGDNADEQPPENTTKPDEVFNRKQPGTVWVRSGDACIQKSGTQVATEWFLTKASCVDALESGFIEENKVVLGVTAGMGGALLVFVVIAGLLVRVI